MLHSMSEFLCHNRLFQRSSSVLLYRYCSTNRQSLDSFRLCRNTNFKHYSSAPNEASIQKHWWSTAQRLTKMDVKVEKDGARAIVCLPGLTFHDFDRTGRVNIRSMQMTLTAARFLAYHTPNSETGMAFLEYDKLTSDRYTFMASTRTSVERTLYDLTRLTVLKENPSFAVSVELGYVGTSSLSSVAKLFCRESGDVYIKNVNQVVTVDKNTRKPKTLSDWWREKYEHMATGSDRLVVPLVEVPDGTHAYDMKVPWSDIDNYKHTTYTAYIRYCQDAAQDATFKNYYSKIREDFLGYNVKDMLICYKGETVANDKLVVKTWENKENPFIVHFSVEKEGIIIFQNTVEVFEK